MKSRGRDLIRRTGVVLAGMLLIGGMMSGAAFAQDTTGGTTGGSTTGSSTTGSSTTGSSTTGGLTGLLTGLLTGGSTTGGTTGGSTTLTGLLTSLLTGGSTTGSTSPTGPSGSNTVVIYSPYPVPVFGDYGKRYYGKYWDHGCGCDRYAAPTYVPQVVNATQVSSVPKGGVDTGDGSFQ